MRKRIISSLLVSALILASLVACGNSDSNENGKVDTQQNESEMGTEIVEAATQVAEVEEEVTEVEEEVTEVEEETTETEKEDTTSENEGKKEGKKEEPKEEETTPSDPPADEPEEESSEVVDDGLNPSQREVLAAGYYNVILTSEGYYAVMIKNSDADGVGYDLINSYLSTFGYEIAPGACSGSGVGSHGSMIIVGEIQPIDNSDPGFNF